MRTENHINGRSELLLPYGRHTPWHNLSVVRSYEDAMPQTTAGNHWSSTENSSNNAWNVNFNNGNTNNNNNNNNNVVRPAVAHDTDWLLLRGSIKFAYKDCLKGKSSSRQCLDYIPCADEDLDVLTDELASRTYTPDVSTCFLVKYPKLREVFAAAFRDRIIHHWIILRLEPLFEQLFNEQGNVTHNCRKNFGTKTAVESVEQGIKHVTGNYQQEATIFKGDLVGFFMSIPQRRLCDKVLEFIEQKYVGKDKDLLLWVTEVVIMHRPEQNCMLNSNPNDWLGLAPNKSLFRCGEGKGMPIGNLTTQQFANFYMAEFDLFVITKLKEHKRFVRRRRKKFKWSYNRFVDDFVIVCNDQKFLMSLVKECEDKLAEMGLQLHKDKRYIQPANHGTMFVGTYIHNNRLYLSNRTLGRFEERIHGFIKYLQKPENEITLAELDHIRDTLNSYLGFCKGRCTYKYRRKMLHEFVQQCQKYYYRSSKYQKIKLRRKYRPIYK